MKRRLDSPLITRPSTVCILSSLLLTAMASATLLTNGSELVLPDRTFVERRTIVNGSQGLTFFVPPGAENLRIVWRTAPNVEIEMLARQGLDIGIDPKSGINDPGPDGADFRTYPNNAGVAEIEISVNTFPKLTAGTLYIGWVTRAENMTVGGSMTVFVDGGPIVSLYDVASSDFDDGIDGWTLNETAAPYPGGTAAGSQSFLNRETERGNPDGFLRLTHRFLSINDYYVAPEKFLTDYTQLADARLEFDLARINGDSVSNFPVDVRIFTEEGGWKWIGPDPPPIPAAFDFFQDEVPMGWRTISVPLREDLWVKMDGTASFAEVMTNPLRLEIRGAYPVTGGSVGLDNVRLLARGEAPARPVKPGVSSFSAGYDRWTRNSAAASTIDGAWVGDADSVLQWSEDGGNGDGFLALAETHEAGGPGVDAFLVPNEYLGIYTDLEEPRFEFDYKHFPFDIGAAVKPVKMRIFGEEGSIYEWTGAAPLDLWAHQVAPLAEAHWTLMQGDGTFAEVLANIVRIEISADQAEGRERNGLDNFALLTAGAPAFPASISVSTESLHFTSAATEAWPDAQTIDITGTGLDVWQADVLGEIADRVSLSSATGAFPAELAVTIDTDGLTEGTYSFWVEITSPGSTLEPRVVLGELLLTEQPVPTPMISQGGVVNAATGWEQLAAGALGVIYGENMGGPESGFVSAFEGPGADMLPTDAFGTKVLIYETYGAMLAEAPILYIDDSQINFQMPFEAVDRSQVRLVVARGGVRSAPHDVFLTKSAPGVFSHSGGWASAITDQGTLVSADASTARTKTLSIYMTGQGEVLPSWRTGRAATDRPLVFTPGVTKVYIGGVEAKVLFAGLAPGLVGVLQVNVEPAYLTPTGVQPMVVNLNGFESNPVNVLIR